MLRRVGVLFALAGCLSFFSQFASAALVHYRYTASAVIVAPTFGITIPSNPHISGSFTYETGLTGVNDPVDPKTTYYQPHNLSIEFRPTNQPSATPFLTAVATDYSMWVSNNLPQPPVGNPADVITFIWDGSNAALSPLTVDDGNPNTPPLITHTGLLNITLVAASTAITNTSIPNDLSFIKFPQGIPASVFGDQSPVGVVDELMSVTSLIVPEPSSWLLFTLGAALVAVYRKRVHRQLG